MSDNEEPVYQEEQEDVAVEVAADSAAAGGISIEDALKGVLRRALVSDGLARGLREATKAISSGQAQLVVLCDSCTEEQYVKLIEALCNEPEQKIPLIKVADAKKIGEWAGLCQIDREGTPRKIVGCSCAVIRDWGEESEERSVILQNFSQ